MRSLLLIMFVFGMVPYVVVQPYLGVLLWSWISYMNPHRLTWGLAYSFPFAEVIGIATLVGLLYSKEPKRIPLTMPVRILILFIIWASISTAVANLPALAVPAWERFLKIQLMTLVTLLLINSRKRLDLLVWVIALSIGFYGVKGGIFTLLKGAQYRVWGPPQSFIEGNNELALALLMILPLMRYLQLQARQRWVRIAFWITMSLIVVSVLGSYSRGAFLGLAVVVLMLVTKSRGRLWVAVAIIGTLGTAFTMLPQDWFQRMETIEHYHKDRSAMGRINVWKFAWRLALDDPLLGGGFETFDRRLYMEYIPEIASDPSTYVAGDAHSIYFQVLAQQGFVGLFLFLALGISTFRACSQARRLALDRKDLAWAGDLAAMLQVSLVAYATSGAFLGLAYFDLYYHLVAMAVMVNVFVTGACGAPDQGRPRLGTRRPGLAVSPGGD